MLPSPGSTTTPLKAKDGTYIFFDNFSACSPLAPIDSKSVPLSNHGIQETLQCKGNPFLYNLSNLFTPKKVVLPGYHSSERSLFFVYPFCNCIVFHCLCIELHQSLLVSHAARCMFRRFVLWHFLPKFRFAFTNVAPRSQQILLCWMCLTQSNKLFLTTQ